MLKQDYEKKDQNTKYAIGISQSPGVAIGDHAHVEQHFHAASPLPPPVSRDDLLSAIRQASAELRAYPSDIAGVHIARAEVRQITDWLLRTDHKERVGMLLDQPGSGKTVVMRDILEYLEASGIPVLAIKADTLSSISNHHDAAERLGLPASVETCARELAAGGTFIVLLDQLDALSLTLSRDQATLDVMLDTVARLRNVDGVRMVASCRTFDLKRDPRLSAIKIDREFRLQPLDDSQVSQVLQTIGTDLTHLLPGHQTLLRVPLHLSIYARIASTDAAADQAESFRSLQELYGALWRKWIEIIPPDVPPPRERIDAIYMLVDAIQNRHQLTAPVAVLDECPEGAIYLERVRFIRQHKGNWSFSHETLFDYCYARRFVAAGASEVAFQAGSTAFLVAAHGLGIEALALAQVFGGLLQFLVVAVALRPRGRLLRPSFDFAGGPVRRLIRLSLPVYLGDTGDKVNLIVTRAFASLLPAGAVSGLQYAYTPVEGIHRMLAGPLTTAFFPFLSSRFAETDQRGARLSLGRALVTVVFVFAPFAAAAWLVAHPLVVVLFERGSFDIRSSGLTASALRLYAPAVLALALNELVGSSFHARQDTLTPMRAGFIRVAGNALLCAVLAPALGHRGIALATTLALFAKLAYFAASPLG